MSDGRLEVGGLLADVAQLNRSAFGMSSSLCLTTLETDLTNASIAHGLLQAAAQSTADFHKVIDILATEGRIASPQQPVEPPSTFVYVLNLTATLVGSLKNPSNMSPPPFAAALGSILGVHVSQRVRFVLGDALQMCVVRMGAEPREWSHTSLSDRTAGELAHPSSPYNFLTLVEIYSETAPAQPLNAGVK